MIWIFSQTREFESNPSHDSTSKKKGRVGRIWAKNWSNPVESESNPSFESTWLELDSNSTRIWAKNWSNPSRIRVEPSRIRVSTRNLDSNSNLTRTRTRFGTRVQKKHPSRIESSQGLGFDSELASQTRTRFTPKWQQIDLHTRIWINKAFSHLFILFPSSNNFFLQNCLYHIWSNI